MSLEYTIRFSIENLESLSILRLIAMSPIVYLEIGTNDPKGAKSNVTTLL